MAQRTLPGLGLVAYFPKGSDNWDDDMNQNMRLLSAVVQAVYQSKDTPLPANAPDGARYIVPETDGQFPNRFAIRDAGAWAYITPQKGWSCFVLDLDRFMYFDGAQWSDVKPAVPQTESIPIVKVEAAARTLVIGDAGSMLVFTTPGPATLMVPASKTYAFPIGTNVIVKWEGIGPVSITGEAGVSFSHTADVTTDLRVQYSEAMLTYLGSDRWDLVGDLAAGA